MSHVEQAHSRTRWQCPHCQDWSQLDDINFERTKHAPPMPHDLVIFVESVYCLNLSCNRETVWVTKARKAWDGRKEKLVQEEVFHLIPSSREIPQPDYIPSPICSDYYEACRIVNLSPKAAATLARRCLQGMIRDFFNVKKRNLNEEINAIREKTDDEIWLAIDAVRKIGNISAHMEHNGDVLIDVDENVARQLIVVIEQIFEEWYVARHKRKLRLDKMKEVADAKDEERKSRPGDGAEETRRG